MWQGWGVHEESPGEGVGEGAAQLQQGPSILEIPVPWEDNQEQQQWNGASRNLCVLQREEPRRL